MFQLHEHRSEKYSNFDATFRHIHTKILVN